MVNPRSLLLFLALGLLPHLVLGQSATPPQPLRVAVYGSNPFVTVTNDGTFEGLSIDVWEQVAAKNAWTFQYALYPHEKEALEAISEGKADLLIGDIGIVSDLFGSVEFSQPYFRAGLQIMVPGARPRTFSRLVEDLEIWGHLKAFWILIGAIAIASILVALFERKHNPDFPKSWPDGLAEALYYVVSLSLGKSGYKGFGGWFGRVVMIIWTIIGVVVVIYMTSSVTSVMTAEAINSHIIGPESLPGKVVGAVTGTRAVEYLQKHNITYNEYSGLDEAVQKLLKGAVPALVGSAPILQSYDKSHPTLDITEVGRIFEHYNYGFAMPIGSPLRASLNRALLDLQENGILLKIGQNYFGDVYQP